VRVFGNPLILLSLRFSLRYFLSFFQTLIATDVRWRAAMATRGGRERCAFSRVRSHADHLLLSPLPKKRRPRAESTRHITTPRQRSTQPGERRPSSPAPVSTYRRARRRPPPGTHRPIQVLAAHAGRRRCVAAMPPAPPPLVFSTSPNFFPLRVYAWLVVIISFHDVSVYGWPRSCSLACPA
jgi:hypothetical protein